MLAPCPTFVLTWGSRGARDGELDAPIDVAVAPSGEVFVTGFHNRRVQRFSAGGEFIGAFPTAGAPSGLAVGREGLVYVAEFERGEINGKRLRRFKMDTTPATVQQLLQDLYDHEDVSYYATSGDGLFNTYFRGKPGPPGFWVAGTTPYVWFRYEGGGWGLWSELDKVTAVQFVRGTEHDDPERETRGIRFFRSKDGPSFGFGFEGLYDEQKRPVPARFARWEALRAKYGGQDELWVENGRLIPPASA